jgi:hypothetical protein
MFTPAELRYKGKDWQRLLGSSGLAPAEVKRAKELHRRELCKGYSRDTRVRTSVRRHHGGADEMGAPILADAALSHANQELRGEVLRLKARIAQLEGRL